MDRPPITVAFVVGDFPLVTETFLVNQAVDLRARGIGVEIFAFGQPTTENVTERFFSSGLADSVHYIRMPERWVPRLLAAIPIAWRLLSRNRGALLRAFDVRRYGRGAVSLRNLFWIAPFLDRRFDLVHAHFGPVARDYLVIKQILRHEQKLVVSFYGYDASLYLRTKPAGYYDGIKAAAARVIVMSSNMRDRLIGSGFDGARIRVIPPGIDVASYPYRPRALGPDEPVRIVSVGRFVEKKGFDDLLQALALLRERATRPFRCVIVGDGEMRDTLMRLTAELKLADLVEYRSYLKIQEIVKLFLEMHVFVQPSKTARSGDME